VEGGERYLARRHRLLDLMGTLVGHALIARKRVEVTNRHPDASRFCRRRFRGEAFTARCLT